MVSLEALLGGTCMLIVGLIASPSRGQKAINNHFSVDCFGKYLTERAEISIKYKDTHLACEQADITTTWPLRVPEAAVAVLDVEGEKDHFAQMTDEMCWNLRACNLIKDTKKSLQCYAETAMENSFKSMDMYFNASSIVIELSDEYEDEEKLVMRCTLQARQAFVTDSSNAFREFLRCLEN